MRKEIDARYRVFLSTVLLLCLVSSVFSFILPAKAQLPPGIPRGDLFVLSMDDPGRILNPSDMNLWKPGATVGIGLVLEPLWLLNVTNGKLVGMLAAGEPEYSADFKSMRIRLRQGVYWSDGVEFTADDVVYTVMLHLNKSGLAQSAYIQKFVEKAEAIDKYTVLLTLKIPNPKLHFTFTTFLGLSGLQIMPKHVWEKVDDPLKYNFNPPIGTSPYVLIDYDPQGYWFLFERREDWERTATGIALGKPKPKYVLRIYYGPDEKEVIAMSKHELDITQIGYESWSVAKSSNPFIMAFLKGYPYVWQHGICDHGVVFNLAKYPYNLTDVRWALTLAINITEVNILGLNAQGRIATFRSLSVPYIQQFYESKLLPWIKNFALSDGYKPFDENVPYKIRDYVETVLGEKLAADPVTIYGPGWWKYDPDEASKLLMKNGFYRDTAGKWHLPDGTLWKIDLVIPVWHGLGSRIGFSVVEQWKKFGIEIQEDAIEAGIFNPRYNTGDFDAVIYWPFCTAAVDTWQWWQGFHNSFLKPVGEVATGNQMRWKNDQVSQLIDELAMLNSFDPKVVDVISEIVKISFQEMPVINMFLGSKLIVFDTYAWSNFPTRDNWYWEHSYWNPQWMLPVLVKIERTGNVPSTEYETPVKPEETEALSQLAARVSTLNATVAQLRTEISTLTNGLEQLKGQITMLMGITAAVGVISIVSIVLVLIKRKASS
ncbi:MAG: ABC transporter substrate-binding protein [Thermoproteota archaeon]